MAEIADIIGANDADVEALAINKGLTPSEYENKEALAGALSPLVTPDEIAALPRVDADNAPETPQDDNEPTNDTPDTDEETDADSDGSSVDDGANDADDGAIFIRLHRGYPLTQSHRRAGITLTPGPEPVRVVVTDEELALLESDRYVEIVSAAEAEKWATHHAAVNGTPDTEPTTSVAPTEVYDDPSNTGAGQPTGGRRYDTGVNGGADPSSDNPDGSIQSERKTREPGTPTETVELKKHADVVNRARELGITPTVAVKGDLLRAAIKTAEADGLEIANAELADAIAAAKKDK